MGTRDGKGEGLDTITLKIIKHVIRTPTLDENRLGTTEYSSGPLTSR